MGPLDWESSDLTTRLLSILHSLYYIYIIVYISSYTYYYIYNAAGLLESFVYNIYMVHHSLQHVQLEHLDLDPKT